MARNSRPPPLPDERSDFQVLADFTMKGTEPPAENTAPPKRGGRTSRPPPADPLNHYDEDRIEALGREIDAALKPILARQGLGYKRQGAGVYRHGISINLFLAFDRRHDSA